MDRPLHLAADEPIPDLNSPYASIRGFLGGIAERPDAAAVNCFSTQVCLNYGFGTVTEDWQFAADSPEAQAGRLLIQDIMDFGWAWVATASA